MVNEKVPIGQKGAYWMKMCLWTEKAPIEKWKVTTVRVFKCIHDINLCSHMAQWEVVNKKSNVSAISYYTSI